MTPLVEVLFAVWAIGSVTLLAGKGRDRPGWTTAWAALGLVPVLVASEQGSWQLGEWSRYLTPVPFFGALALVTVALERTMARVSPRAGAAGSSPGPIAPWLRAAAVVWGLALALLGDSGLALGLVVAMAALLAVVIAVERPPRPELHRTNQ